MKKTDWDIDTECVSSLSFVTFCSGIRGKLIKVNEFFLCVAEKGREFVDPLIRHTVDRCRNAECISGRFIVPWD